MAVANEFGGKGEVGAGSEDMDEIMMVGEG